MTHQPLKELDLANVLHVIKYSDLKIHKLSYSGAFNCISQASSANGNLLRCYHLTQTQNDT